MGWIGIDLDGTLAEYEGWKGPEYIGEPVPTMMKRVKAWIAHGQEVRIFTARAGIPNQVPFVRQWLIKHGLGELVITNEKDFSMKEFWDDRCITVETNTGRVLTLGRIATAEKEIAEW